MFNYIASYSYDYYPAQYYINAHNEQMNSACYWQYSAPVYVEPDTSWAAEIKANLRTMRFEIAQLQQHHRDRKSVICGDPLVGPSADLHTDADTESIAAPEAVVVVEIVSNYCDQQQEHLVDWEPEHNEERDEPCGVDNVPTMREMDEPRLSSVRGLWSCSLPKLPLPTSTLTIKQRSPPTIRLSIGTTTFKEEQCLTRWLGLGPLRLFYTVEKLYFVQCGLLWIFAVLENYATLSNTFGILVEAAGGDVTAQRSTQENPLQLNSPLRLEHWTVCSNRTVSSRRLRDAVLTANPATFSNK
uniref:(northern house mosquito) hypothetical protein n=1 Tax=Culex pipiens TaxID=7175 RepID=A0A8D8GRL4_CULPI